ncbi:hypothetical protein E2542_SST19257 [Spatholobus suberectus]|nr:hypothetical protein E2542_SST19257 [Spatholobus suberectus]
MDQCPKIKNQPLDARDWTRKELCQWCAARARQNTTAIGGGLQNKGEEIRKMKKQDRTTKQRLGRKEVTRKETRVVVILVAKSVTPTAMAKSNAAERRNGTGASKRRRKTGNEDPAAELLPAVMPLQ